MNFKILSVILNVVQTIETVLAKKTGREKLEASVDAAGPIIEQVEDAVGKDVLYQEGVRPAYDAFVTAAIDLMKAIAAAKALKVKPAV